MRCLRLGIDCKLNFEKQRSFVVTVRSTDNGSPPLFNDFKVTINLSDVNDKPRNLSLSNNVVSILVNTLGRFSAA